MGRIIYYSYWGTYAAYTMAAIHAGIYKQDRLPQAEWIAAQYDLCRRYGGQYGNLIYVGLDSRFREIYSLGCRQHSGMVARALKHISKIFQIEEPLCFIDARPMEGKIPGLLQRCSFQWSRTAERLFEAWFSNKYWACLKQVQSAMQELEDGNNI